MEYQTSSKPLATYLQEEGFKLKRKSEGIYIFDYTVELGKITHDYKKNESQKR